MEFKEVFGTSLSPPDNSEPCKSPPNWREAFEQVLAKGCEIAVVDAECAFCRLTEGCAGCPVENKTNGCACADYWLALDSSLRRAIFRHVLKTVKDFTDVSEIRARISEMLDDPERFLGKAEPEKIKYETWWLTEPYKRPAHTGDNGNYGEGPALGYGINTDFGVENLIAAFRDEATRDRVLEFLNA